MNGNGACRFCAATLRHTVVDLGLSPLSNAFVDPSDADKDERLYPLRAAWCDRCWLLQLPQFEAPEQIFGDYAYFSSFSTTWVEHASRFAERAVRGLGLGPQSLVVELASNDGYLLKHFRAFNVHVLGVEPARNVARAAVEAGIPTRADFFGSQVARQIVAQDRRADLVIANNVLAHVPDLNDFVAAMAILLGDDGAASVEVPHLLRTIERAEFDTIYHEHFSYFSLHTAERVFAAHGLAVTDVEELPTHGGSLRIWLAHPRSPARPTAAVERVKNAELAAGLDHPEAYASLAVGAARVKRELVEFLAGAARDGKRVAGYGAPAKATTLLNYCGVRTDLLPFTVDRNPYKQGRLIPGVRVPIERPQRLFETKPDYVLILPWNIEGEIREQMGDISSWGGRFVVPIPSLRVSP